MRASMRRTNDLSPFATRIALAAVLIAGALLRGYDLTKPFGREIEGWTGAFYATMARNMLVQGTLTPTLNPHPDDDAVIPYVNHPPGVPWLVASSFALCGEYEWAARLPFLIASLLSILYAFRLGRRLGGNTAGLAASVALATTPVAAAYGTQVEVVGPWLLLATLGLVNAYFECCTRPALTTRLWLAGWTLVALLTDWPALLLIAVLWARHWFRFPQRRLTTLAWGAGTAAGLALLICWLLTRDPRFGLEHLVAKIHQRTLRLATDSQGVGEGRPFSLVELGARYVWLQWKLFGLVMITLAGGWLVVATRRRFEGHAIPALLWLFAIVFYAVGAQGHFQHNFWSQPVAAAYAVSAAAALAALNLRVGHAMWLTGLMALANLSALSLYRNEVIPARSGDPLASEHHDIATLLATVPAQDHVLADDQSQWPTLPFYLPREYATLRPGRTLEDYLLARPNTLQPWQRYLVTHKLLPPGTDERGFIADRWSKQTRWFVSRNKLDSPGVRAVRQSGIWTLHLISPAAFELARSDSALAGPINNPNVGSSQAAALDAHQPERRPLTPPFGFVDAFQTLGVFALLAIAASFPVLDRSFTQAIANGLEAIGRIPGAAPLLCCVTAVLLAVVLTGLTWVPVPVVHDEFAYLLTADTFGQSRVVNETHTFWRHFESQHIFHEPAYQAKYPPAQGLCLAAGRVVLGHPIAGVWLSLGLACAAVCWALQASMPTRWAFLGGLLCALHPWIAYRWGNTYWGGSVAMLGGALLFGGVLRLLRRPCGGAAFWTAIGLAILANSRPFEGLVVAIPLFVAVGASVISNRQLWRGRLGSVVETSALVLIPTVALMVLYNQALTGDPFKLPYVHHEQLYAVAPSFVWQSPRPTPEYRHESLRRIHAEWEVYPYEQQRESPAMLLQWFVWKLQVLWGFFYGKTLWLPLVALPLVWSRRSVKLATASVSLLLVAFFSHTYMQPHYAAPATVLFVLLSVQGMRGLRTWCIGPWQAGRFLVHGVLLIQLGTLVPFAICYHNYFARFATPGGLLVAFRARDVSDPGDYLIASAVLRERIRDHLTERGGRHLIFVRYEPGHDPLFEWVFNEADIDGAPIVWAHDMGDRSNARLCDYCTGRHVWRLTVAGGPPVLQSLSRTSADSLSPDDMFVTGIWKESP